MSIFSGVNYWAVLVSAVVYFLIGAFWYSVPFRDAWIKASGVKMGGNTPVVLPMIGQFVSSFIFALAIAVVLNLMGNNGVLSGLLAGIFVIIGFVFPLNSGTLFFQGNGKLFSIDGGYQAVGALASGIILGLWR